MWPLIFLISIVFIGTIVAIIQIINLFKLKDHIYWHKHFESQRLKRWEWFIAEVNNFTYVGGSEKAAMFDYGGRYLIVLWFNDDGRQMATVHLNRETSRKIQEAGENPCILSTYDETQSVQLANLLSVKYSQIFKT